MRMHWFSALTKAEVDELQLSGPRGHARVGRGASTSSGGAVRAGTPSGVAELSERYDRLCMDASEVPIRYEIDSIICHVKMNVVARVHDARGERIFVLDKEHLTYVKAHCDIMESGNAGAVNERECISWENKSKY